jgi:hypothetical protein
METLRIISQQTLDIGEEFCAYFMEGQKAFDRKNWTKFMQILRGSGIDWCERRLISRLQVYQSVKPKLD